MSTIIDPGERIAIVEELLDSVQRLLCTEVSGSGLDNAPTQEYLVLPQLLLFD